MSMSAPTDVPRQKTKKQELNPQPSQKIRVEKSDSRDQPGRSYRSNRSESTRGSSLTHRQFDDPRLKDLL